MSDGLYFGVNYSTPLIANLLQLKEVFMGLKFSIYVVENSPAEQYYMEHVVPKLKGEHSVRLGRIWRIRTDAGEYVNEYTMGLIDRIRVRKELEKMKF